LAQRVSDLIVMVRSAWDASTAPPSLNGGVSAQLAGTAQVRTRAAKTVECNMRNMGKLLELVGPDPENPMARNQWFAAPGALSDIVIGH